MDERCIEGLDLVPAEARGGVLTIGNFDGVHVGHRRILAVSREVAAPKGLSVVAMTFDPPPDLVLRPLEAPRRILPAARKVQALREAGADWVVTAKADRALLGMEPTAFVEQILVAHFAPRHLVEGHDFTFGRRAGGDVAVLRAAGEEHGFAVHVVDPVRVDLPDGVQAASSTLVRDLVSAGRVADAAIVLGGPFALFGPVVAGAGRGRILEFPTINLDVAEQVLPADGIYAGRATIGPEQFVAAISVGTKPTLGPAPRVVEAHLVDADGTFYDRSAALHFFRRLRDQRRFDGIESLKRQIAKDVERVRELCG